MKDFVERTLQNSSVIEYEYQGDETPQALNQYVLLKSNSNFLS